MKRGFQIGRDLPLKWFEKKKRGRLDAFQALLALFLITASWRMAALRQGARDFSNACPAFARRPEILAANGARLAFYLPAFELCADTSAMAGNAAAKAAAASALGSAIPRIPKAEIEKRLGVTSRCALITPHATPDECARVRAIGDAALGCSACRNDMRHYPDRNLFAHILGGVNRDGKGISGIEKYIDDAGLADSREAIRLGVNPFVQGGIYAPLREAMDLYGAKAAAAIVMDTRTGEILGMASLPDFDANNAGSFALSQAHKNHATADLYEMGSVMKIFNHALAIENGLDQSAVFDVSKPEFIGAHPVADSHPHERLSFAEAFAQSSNRAAIQIARKTGLAAQKEFFAKLGFFDRIPLESGDSAMPTRPERWTRTTGLSASYGYGHAITMLHAAAGANSIVGEGIYIAPTMLALKPDQHNIRNRQTAKESTSAAMRELMGEVVREGTGRAAGGGEVDLGGKTGTANKYDPALRGYASDKKRTFFIAALPLANPTFTLMIMLDEPKNGACTDASCTAAPVARKIIDGISPLLAGRR